MQLTKRRILNKINHNDLLPGDVIAIHHHFYKHFAIVSDQRSTFNGITLPNLISLSYRTGTVQEEPWHVVVSDNVIEKSTIAGNKPSKSVLSRARACILLEIQYDLLTFNCEHFVRYAHGLSIESMQVKNTMYGAVLGAASCLLFPKVTMLRFALMTATGAITSLKYSLNKI